MAKCDRRDGTRQIARDVMPTQLYLEAAKRKRLPRSRQMPDSHSQARPKTAAACF